MIIWRQVEDGSNQTTQPLRDLNAGSAYGIRLGSGLRFVRFLPLITHVDPRGILRPTGIARIAGVTPVFTYLGVEHMSKLENTIVGILLGGACVWLSFVACWWTAAMIHMYEGVISVNIVILAALTGLLIGIVLDVLFLKRWIRGFYAASLWLLAAVYVALCVLAVASFMGLPVGTFALGLMAGAYAGRRQLHNPSNVNAGHGLRRASFFAALVTAGAALPIGILGLREQSVADLFQKLLGIESWGGGVMVVCLLCVVLFGAQYSSSLIAGRLALTMGSTSAQPDGAANGSQPIRSETNRTSPAAGARR